jgi:ribosomal protein S18 acetylase RimI-like enzyme
MTGIAESIESNEQLALVWRALALDRNPAADVRDLPGIAVRWAECRFAFLNCLTLTDVGATTGLLEQRLTQAADIMRSKNYPGYLWVFVDLLDGPARTVLNAAADRAGLEYVIPATGMAGDILPIPDPSHPDLIFVRVTTDEHVQALADLNSRAYGLPVEEGRDGFGGSVLLRKQAYAYLGMRDGVPVTTASTLEADGRLIVIMVATDPDCERKGYGEAVTRKALHEGAKATGLTRATLHATAAGAPVYPRIGFKPNSPMRLYTLKG